MLEAIRRTALAGGELANAYVGTVRLKLLKIGAVVLRNTRRMRLLLSGSFPRQALFHAAAAKLRPDEPAGKLAFHSGDSCLETRSP